jgi:hypothetical protein
MWVKYLMFISLTTFSLYGSIGYIANFHGKVSIIRDGLHLNIYKGRKLESGDVLETGDNSKIRIIFNDQTSIKIGRNSIFKVDSYWYDNTTNSKAVFTMKKGFFGVVSGKIGKIARRHFQFKTKKATIGIRGTHFQGFISDTKENIFCLKGVIIIHYNNQNVELNNGEMVSIANGEIQEPKAVNYDLSFDKLDEISYFNLDNFNDVKIIKTKISTPKIDKKFDFLDNKFQF